MNPLALQDVCDRHLARILEPQARHHYGDTCAILWTSGITGRSKGVVQAHVAAYGIPSEELASEDELMLRLVLREGAMTTPEEICAAAPHYFVPRYLDFVPELP